MIYLYNGPNSPSLVNREFNVMCEKAGIQTCVQANGLTDAQYLEILSFSYNKKLVRITYDGKTHFLEPGEKMNLELTYGEELPVIKALNNGLDTGG